MEIETLCCIFTSNSPENENLFLGAIAKLRKETISFLITVRQPPPPRPVHPSVRMQILGSHMTDFHEI
jgi:hypothetical protein